MFPAVFVAGISIGLLMMFIAFRYYRYPEIKYLTPRMRIWRPGEFIRPIAVPLWGGGLMMVIVSFFTGLALECIGS
jgi:hypothetical protein